MTLPASAAWALLHLVDDAVARTETCDDGSDSEVLPVEDDEGQAAWLAVQVEEVRTLREAGAAIRGALPRPRAT